MTEPIIIIPLQIDDIGLEIAGHYLTSQSVVTFIMILSGSLSGEMLHLVF